MQGARGLVASWACQLGVSRVLGLWLQLQPPGFSSTYPSLATWALTTCIVIKLRWNELLCSWEIVNQHFETKEWFSTASCVVLWELCSEAKTWVFVVVPCLLLWHQCLSLQCIEFRWIKLFYSWKSRIGILKENNVFWHASSEVLTAVLWESRARKLCTCQLPVTWLDTMMDIRVSG